MKKIILHILLLLCMFPLAAQESDQFSLQVNTGFPVGEFKEAVDNSIGGAAVGLGLNVLFNPKGKKGYSPVFFGPDLSYMTFGRDKIESTNDTPPFKTTFNYYAINGMTRIFLSNTEAGFVPFIDGTLGLRIFNTRTKVDKNVTHIIFDDNQPEVIHTTNDSGLGYGLGMGWYTRKARDEESSTKASFTLRVMHLWGDPTSYVRRGSIKVENGFVTYETGYTQTNMIMVQLGVLFY
ncbi:outer membrane beta-barrel protein [Oscillatoria amoena NRMC-F 0135]|nr:outer membrane beta-barrel protein [Oscillatoria amoena NRMC-F 0135]